MAWLRAHPRLADGALGLALFVLCLLPAMSGGTTSGAGRSPNELHAGGILLLLLTTLPLAWRRSHPEQVVTTIALAAVAYEVIEQPETANAIAALVAVYSATAWGSRRTARAVGVITAIAIAVIIAVNNEGGWSWVDVVANYAIFATAWVLGDNMRQRRERLASLEERALLAERSREDEARRAVAAERTRIARELHDVVAHSVSVMVVQAGAARRVLDRSPEQAAEALAQIEAVGRESLQEMRRLLGVLRREDERSFGRDPQPSIDHLDVLVTQVRDAGLAVDLAVEGEPRPLPPGVDLSAYRIVQEALTNTMKHAGRDARAEVRVCYGDEVVELVVSDDGRGADHERAGEAAGHGLVGMRERVNLYGGVLEVGNRRGGGFVVRARLPLQVPA